MTSPHSSDISAALHGLRLLTLSGWTQPTDALAGLLPPDADAAHIDYSGASSPEAVAELLAGTQADLMVGWSLGGVLARQLVRMGAVKTRALVLIAAPLQFVRDSRLKEAMPAETFEQFYANYRDDTARTVRRFHGLLVKDDTRARDILPLLGHHHAVGDVARWLPWMDFLRRYSAYDHDYSSLPPSLIIQGRRDAIVHPSQAEALAAMLPNARLTMLEESGHTPHHHDVLAVRDAICRFWRELEPQP